MANDQRDLRAQAAQVISANTRLQTSLPQNQWWNIPAKIAAGRVIADQELSRSRGHHNDHEDGMRHARWSQRMADEIGPGFAAAVGLEHELQGFLPPKLGGGSQPISEGVMDLINNSEGLLASTQHRSVDPEKIQERPISLGVALGRAGQRYEDVTLGRATYPSRTYGQGSAAKGYRDAPRYDPESRRPPY